LYTGFQLAPTLVTLNGVIALILRYFTKYDSFALQADYVTVVEDWSIMSAKYRLQLHLAKSDSDRETALQGAL